MSEPLPTSPRDPAAFPVAPFFDLDTLWFQVAGTLCNLTCTHCFISCGPTNHAHEMMSLAAVRPYLAEAAERGVREYYFTGGEPFMNREMFEILEATLAQGPATVLTNGTLLDDAKARRLKALADASAYSLDLRVSIDGWDGATNDPIRGDGTFARILEGVRALANAGLNPALTVTEAFDGVANGEGREKFLAFLRGLGLAQPRLKVLPLLRIGAEVTRLRGYKAWETLRGRTIAAEEAAALQCTSGRMVTSRGVYVCPLLVDSPAARMGETLAQAARPFPLAHQACYTCHEQGLSCRT